MLLTKSGDLKIAVIGLGYVGLPLALAFAERFNVIGYDINQEHINLLRQGKDKSLQVNESELLNFGLSLTSSSGDISELDLYYNSPHP